VVLLFCLITVSNFANIHAEEDPGQRAITPVKVIVARPVSKYGSANLEDMWLLLLCENYLHFRLQGVDGISVVPAEVLSSQIKGYSEYREGAQSVTLDKYTDAAMKLSVTYIIYIQCEYFKFGSGNQVNTGDDVNFFGKVQSIYGSEPIFVEAKQFPLKKIGFKLDLFVSKVIETLKAETTPVNRKFLETKVLRDDAKKIKMLGKYLAVFNDPGADGATVWDKSYGKYKRFIKDGSDMLLGYYAAGKVFESVKKYKEGAAFFYTITDMMESQFPRAYIEASRLYRLHKNYKQSLSILENATGIPSIEHDLKVEKAILFKEMGHTIDALYLASGLLDENRNDIIVQTLLKQHGLYKEKYTPLDFAAPVDSSNDEEW